jgi:hypothetical protein
MSFSPVNKRKGYIFQGYGIYRKYFKKSF